MLLLERAQVPRFYVGESLVPESFSTLQRLRVWPWLEKMFEPKCGVQFGGQSGSESKPFFFRDTDDRRCWFWYMPLTNDRVSVGRVLEGQGPEATDITASAN